MQAVQQHQVRDELVAGERRRALRVELDDPPQPFAVEVDERLHELDVLHVLEQDLDPRRQLACLGVVHG